MRTRGVHSGCAGGSGSGSVTSSAGARAGRSTPAPQARRCPPRPAGHIDQQRPVCHARDPVGVEHPRVCADSGTATTTMSAPGSSVSSSSAPCTPTVALRRAVLPTATTRTRTPPGAHRSRGRPAPADQQHPAVGQRPAPLMRHTPSDRSRAATSMPRWAAIIDRRPARQCWHRAPHRAAKHRPRGSRSAIPSTPAVSVCTNSSAGIRRDRSALDAGPHVRRDENAAGGQVGVVWERLPVALHGTGRSPAAAGTRSQPGSTIVGPKWRYFPMAASKRTHHVGDPEGPEHGAVGGDPEVGLAQLSVLVTVQRSSPSATLTCAVSGRVTSPMVTVPVNWKPPSVRATSVAANSTRNCRRPSAPLVALRRICAWSPAVSGLGRQCRTAPAGSSAPRPGARRSGGRRRHDRPRKSSTSSTRSWPTRRRRPRLW